MKINHLIKVSLMLTGLAFTSCSKQEILEKDIPLKVKSISSFAPMSLANRPHNVLGAGYDITGELASAESARVQVLDLEKLEREEPFNLLPNDDVTQSFEHVSGFNASDYLTQLNIKYKSTFSIPLPVLKDVFSGSFKANYGDSTFVSSKYAYSSTSLFISQKRIRIYNTSESLRDNFLTANFKSEVTTLSAKDLVAKYGTHVLTNITLGAKLTIGYRSQTNAMQRTEIVKAGASAGILKVFSVDWDADAKKQMSTSNYDQSLHYQTVGGDGTKGLIGDIRLDNSPPTITISAWQSTCTRDNAALIRIGQNGLVPLDALIADPVKKAEVANYIVQYIEAAAIGMTDEPSIIYSFYSPRDLNHILVNSASWSHPLFENHGPLFKSFVYSAANTVPLYTYYSAKDTNHFYTTDNAPTLINGRYENHGIACYVHKSPAAGTIPIYQHFNAKITNHHFSSATYINGYANEGIAFYAYPTSFSPR